MADPKLTRGDRAKLARADFHYEVQSIGDMANVRPMPTLSSEEEEENDLDLAMDDLDERIDYEVDVDALDSNAYMD